jgi:hypothetical protein
MDSESQNLETNLNGQPGNMVHDDRTVLQSVRFRYRTVLANAGNWQFMESQLRFVLHSGTILWLLFLLSLAI